MAEKVSCEEPEPKHINLHTTSDQSVQEDGPREDDCIGCDEAAVPCHIGTATCANFRAKNQKP